MMTLDTHIPGTGKLKLSMFAKKTGFPKLEPLLLTNQYDGVSYRGVQRFSVVFFGENEVDAEICPKQVTTRTMRGF